MSKEKKDSAQVKIFETRGHENITAFVHRGHQNQQKNEKKYLLLSIGIFFTVLQYFYQFLPFKSKFGQIKH